jgi:hypothetical protein
VVTTLETTVRADFMTSRNETTQAKAEARTLQELADRLTGKNVKGVKRKPTP